MEKPHGQKINPRTVATASDRGTVGDIMISRFPHRHRCGFMYDGLIDSEYL